MTTYLLLSEVKPGQIFKMDRHFEYEDGVPYQPDLGIEDFWFNMFNCFENSFNKKRPKDFWLKLTNGGYVNLRTQQKFVGNDIDRNHRIVTLGGPIALKLIYLVRMFICWLGFHGWQKVAYSLSGRIDSECWRCGKCTAKLSWITGERLVEIYKRVSKHNFEMPEVRSALRKQLNHNVRKSLKK